MKCSISFILGAVAIVCLKAMDICGYGVWMKFAAAILFAAVVQLIADFKK